ncbi:hypothetical protein SKAU_G00391290 [Synaphobranchus kaupii]|uniref:Uncharacterized protein n=1 Tax=Synaphobranchus kaupii TaxID=118154 RepID=A0A9Q1EBL6_SYNKA|nr:hypothetical protein SKAU_G00391290 [Synaphobranchus kaupii]
MCVEGAGPNGLKGALTSRLAARFLQALVLAPLCFAGCHFGWRRENVQPSVLPAGGPGNSSGAGSGDIQISSARETQLASGHYVTALRNAGMLFCKQSGHVRGPTCPHSGPPSADRKKGDSGRFCNRLEF